MAMRSPPARTCSRWRCPQPRCDTAEYAAGIDIIQTDVPQSYGIGTAARVLEMLERTASRSASSVLAPCGNQMSLNQSAGFGYGHVRGLSRRLGVFLRLCGRPEGGGRLHHRRDWPGLGFERQAAPDRACSGTWRNRDGARPSTPQRYARSPSPTLARKRRGGLLFLSRSVFPRIQARRISTARQTPLPTKWGRVGGG